MPLKTTKFDAADYLTTPESIAVFLEDAFNDNDPAAIAHALGVAARAKGMTEVARQSGISRQTLYSALSSEGNPSLETLLCELKAVGLQLQVKPLNS